MKNFDEKRKLMKAVFIGQIILDANAKAFKYKIDNEFNPMAGFFAGQMISVELERAKAVASSSHKVFMHDKPKIDKRRFKRSNNKHSGVTMIIKENKQ